MVARTKRSTRTVASARLEREARSIYERLKDNPPALSAVVGLVELLASRSRQRRR